MAFPSSRLWACQGLLVSRLAFVALRPGCLGEGRAGVLDCDRMIGVKRNMNHYGPVWARPVSLYWDVFISICIYSSLTSHLTTPSLNIRPSGVNISIVSKTWGEYTYEGFFHRFFYFKKNATYSRHIHLNQNHTRTSHQFRHSHGILNIKQSNNQHLQSSTLLFLLFSGKYWN